MGERLNDWNALDGTQNGLHGTIGTDYRTVNGLHRMLGTVNRTLNGLYGTIGTVNGTLNGLHRTVFWCKSTLRGLYRRWDQVSRRSEHPLLTGRTCCERQYEKKAFVQLDSFGLSCLHGYNHGCADAKSQFFFYPTSTFSFNVLQSGMCLDNMFGQSLILHLRSKLVYFFLFWTHT
jgi:hypothetical protein